MILDAERVSVMAERCGWWLHVPGWSALRQVSFEAEALWHLLVEGVLDRLSTDPLAVVTTEVLRRVERRHPVDGIRSTERLLDELVVSRLLRPADDGVPDAAPPPDLEIPGLSGPGQWVHGPASGWEIAGSPYVDLVEFTGELVLDFEWVERLQLEVRRDLDGAWLYRTAAWS
jgi:hypothetical protein